MANPDRIPDAVSVAVAAELRARSARKQVRQRSIAEAMGMAQSSVSDKWRGEVPLTVSQFVSWCRALNESPADVLRAALATVPDSVPDNVRALMSHPGPGKSHPDLPSVTRWPEDGEAAADESLDEDAVRDERGE